MFVLRRSYFVTPVYWFSLFLWSEHAYCVKYEVNFTLNDSIAHVDIIKCHIFKCEMSYVNNKLKQYIHADVNDI